MKCLGNTQGWFCYRAILAGPSGTIVSPAWGSPLIVGPSKLLGGL